MSSKLLFYYFGDDEAYFRTLMGEFKTHTRLQIEFKRVFESKENKIQGLFTTVLRERPACIFIDFSKFSNDYLHLARIISRTLFDHKLITIGLLDYLSPIEIMMESMATGVNLTYIKSAETYDVIFDIAKLIAPNEIGAHGFATAKLNEDREAGIPVKIGYVHKEGIHLETDYQLKVGDQIKMNHPWTEKRIVPSRVFTVKNVASTNLYYHFKNAVDVNFLFVDQFIPPEGMEESTINERIAEREEMIIYHQKLLSRWIKENSTGSYEKKAKVLVIDRDFHFYDNKPRTDKFPYTIRCIPHLVDIGTDIDRLKPQVIAFSIDKEDAENPKNTAEVLGKLVAALKVKMADSLPFLVVFNTTESSKVLQETLSYPHIIASDGELSVELMVRMADAFEKKIVASMPKSQKGEEKVFLKNSNKSSIGEILIPIKILKLSESDMFIQTEAPLVEGMNLHLTDPVNMFVNIQPTKSQGKTFDYHGLIHCLGEVEKKELRRFVNSVFFREHDAKVTAATDEFKKLNEAKLLQKQEELKLAEQQALEEAQEDPEIPAKEGPES